MLTVTFIRHGQSLDNPRGVWGGWKDAPLSPLGERQAAALGEHLSSTRFDYIYASTLSRAKHTGLAVHAKQAHNPPFTENPNLREQHFGIAEGHKWVFDAPDELTNPDGSFDLEGCYARNIFPVGIERFPGGESQADLSVRATQALRECVFPHLNEAKTKDVHVGIASHGLCIGELVSALLSFDPQDKGGVEYTGLENTAWSRAQVELLDDLYDGKVDPKLRAKVILRDQGQHLANLYSEEVTAEADEEKERKAKAQAFMGGKTDV